MLHIYIYIYDISRLRVKVKVVKYLTDAELRSLAKEKDFSSHSQNVCRTDTVVKHRDAFYSYNDCKLAPATKKLRG